MSGNPTNAKWMRIILGFVITLALLLACILIAIPLLTGLLIRSSPYKIPPELFCTPQPFPTTTAELPSMPIDWSPIILTNGQYDFVKGVCEAGWYTGNPYWNQIPCTGNINDKFGMVMATTHPNVEDDVNYTNALLVKPSPEYCWSEGDLAPLKHQPYIQGQYDCIDIGAKDRFHAWVGCMKNSFSCDLTFILTAYGEHIPQTDLGMWKEIHNGSVTEVDLDLSSLAGNCIMFELVVESNTLDVTNANALWLDPKIIKAK